VSDNETPLTPYVQYITSEHRRPLFTAAVDALAHGPSHITSLLQQYTYLFDLDSAVGEQLDMVGEWVGHSRYILTPLPNVYFCWDNLIEGVDGVLDPAGDVGWDEGVWYEPYQPTTGYAILDDDHYRTLLRAKIVANYWDGTVPGAYEAWNTLFQGQYEILIQNGMAAAASTFTWDGEARQGWDRSCFATLVRHTNFVRYSSTEVAGITRTLPPHWSLPGHLSYSVVDVVVEQGLEILRLSLSGATLTDTNTSLWFEDRDGISVHPIDRPDWRFSLYFLEDLADPAITGRFLEIVVYDEDFVQIDVASTDPALPSDDSTTDIAGLARSAVVYLGADLADRAKWVRPRLRLEHPRNVTVTDCRISLAGVQLEATRLSFLERLVSQGIFEFGDSTLGGSDPLGERNAALDPAISALGPWIKTTGRALVAYYRPPNEARVNGGMHMITGLIVPFYGTDYTVSQGRVTEMGETRADETGLARGTEGSVGVGAGPPVIDAVLLALFTGGHLDLRPAGVTGEYCIQTKAGAPMFAWDAGPDDGAATLTAPPQYVSGWDSGAWAKFIEPTLAPYS
jgi:hypothetical protein